MERTERIKNCLNPSFSKTFIIDYYFEVVQKLRFGIYDIDNKTVELSDDDFLGECECTLGQVGVSLGWAGWQPESWTFTNLFTFSVRVCPGSVLSKALDRPVLPKTPAPPRPGVVSQCRRRHSLCCAVRPGESGFSLVFVSLTLKVGNHVTTFQTELTAGVVGERGESHAPQGRERVLARPVSPRSRTFQGMSPAAAVQRAGPGSVHPAAAPDGPAGRTGPDAPTPCHPAHCSQPGSSL